MNGQLQTCPTCGNQFSSLLGDNCPACLMRLGTPLLREEQAEPGDVPHAKASRSGGHTTYPVLRDYRLLEAIARGQRGTVYRAWQTSLKRTVVAKVFVTAEFANLDVRKRFRREAEAAINLNHPNIVAIYEVGEQDGWPFLAMELIEGRDLAEMTRDKPVSARQAAEWLKTIAQAVHFAHEKGVVHGNLKSSNVLVDENAVPHITDFGVANGVARGEDLTSPYMPPEQANGKGGELARAADIYSLGAILYQLLTARPPFLAESLSKTLQLIAEAEPVSPRLLNPWVPRDLETICLKCLEKDPGRRYGTAQEMANELERFLRDQPIQAKPSRRWTKLPRFF